MNRFAPLAGLLLIGTLMGTILSLQNNQILIPFIIQRQVVYNPANYLNNLTFYNGETGSITLPNIMQAVVYTNSVTITISTLVVNTTAGFSRLTFTLRFGTTVVTLSGLQNVTESLTLTQGIYPVSLVIDYTASSNQASTVQGTATIMLST